MLYCFIRGYWEKWRIVPVFQLLFQFYFFSVAIPWPLTLFFVCVSLSLAISVSPPPQVRQLRAADECDLPYRQGEQLPHWFWWCRASAGWRLQQRGHHRHNQPLSLGNILYTHARSVVQPVCKILHEISPKYYKVSYQIWNWLFFPCNPVCWLC